MCDFVSDVIRRALAAAGSDSESAVIAAEIEIRREWGGERIYVSKTGHADLLEMTERNKRIMRDWNAGERVSALARKYRLSKQRISQLIKQASSELP